MNLFTFLMTAGENIIADLFDGAGSALSGLLTLIGDAITGVVGMVYSTTTGFTTFGYLILIPVGTAIVWLIIKVIRSLVARA